MTGEERLPRAVHARAKFILGGGVLDLHVGLSRTFLVAHLRVDARHRGILGEVVALLEAVNGHLHGRHYHPDLVAEVLPLRFEEYGGFQDDDRASILAADLLHLVLDEGADLRPDDCVQALQLAGRAEDLAAEDTTVDRAVLRDDVMPEGVHDLLEPGGTRLIRAVSQAVSVDDDSADLAEHLRGRRLSRRNPPGEADDGHYVLQARVRIHNCICAHIWAQTLP